MQLQGLRTSTCNVQLYKINVTKENEVLSCDLSNLLQLIKHVTLLFEYLGDILEAGNLRMKNIGGYPQSLVEFISTQ